ncbi:hypothetical protein PIROE2DRAFT_15415 [Piromyces sp. E2]|nr:hypothetical protein PIROE2DRAFT_15415 [Piromyces sp. E2]|eukprot:OUM59133.1 hypothetical protein PIROE2DRAFT_15415 [Piromyces sp. E2]
MPNKLNFKHKDKNIENFINIIFSDYGLWLYLNNKKKFLEGDYIKKSYFDNYNIPDRITDFEILYTDKYDSSRYKRGIFDENQLWFGNKYLFNINYDLKIRKIYELKFHAYSYQEIKENDSSMDKNLYFYYDITIKCCVIGSLMVTEVYGKTIEEYARVLGPTWYVNQNRKYIPYHSSLIIGINIIRHATGGCSVVCNVLISATNEKQYRIINFKGNVSIHTIGDINKVAITIGFSESKSERDDANTTHPNEYSEAVIHDVTKDDTHTITEINDSLFKGIFTETGKNRFKNI